MIALDAAAVAEDRTMSAVDDPHGFVHRFVETNGVRLHYVEEGCGPLVLLLHGFPYLWYAWRHQIRALAGAGYRVVAPDFRGFGQSECPVDVQSYDIFRIVADQVGLLRCLGESSAIVVGHDLGAWIAAAAAQLRPDLFAAFVMLNTPIGPREPCRPSELWKQLQAATGKRLHHYYFQEPGLADSVMNADIRRTLRSIHYSISGSAAKGRWRPLIGEGETILDTVVDPDKLPTWLPPTAMDYYVAEYERHGFAGPLNYYRCRDRNWEQTAFLVGQKPRQPSMFIGGAADPALDHSRAIYDQLESHLPNLRRKVLLEGVGHSAAEEKPETVNRMLLEFLAAA